MNILVSFFANSYIDILNIPFNESLMIIVHIRHQNYEFHKNKSLLEIMPIARVERMPKGLSMSVTKSFMLF